MFKGPNVGNVLLSRVKLRSGNDRYPVSVTGIGFVLRDFSKVFSHTFRLDLDLDKAELTLRAVIK